MVDDAAARLGAEVLSWWRYYNRLYLRNALREPVVRVAPASSLGSWDRELRTLSISSDHLSADPWLAVMETLRHEMAHQYAHEVLGAVDERPHGQAFREACHKLRVEARATAVLGAPVEHPRTEVIGRISKLLSLSSSPNENEAQAAVNKARELLLRHNIAAVDVEKERRFGHRWLGTVKGRHPYYEQILARILNDFFFVSVIWTQTYDAARGVRGTVLGVHGTEANLQMAEYVYDYLTSVLGSLWRDYKEKGGLRGNGERMRYFAGVLEGFHEKLGAQEKRLAESHALVWKGDAQLDAYVRYHHPSIRVDYTRGAARTKAYEDGVAQGREVTLRRPLGAESSGFGGLLRG